ncbi:MAG: vWA domain-containing protein [Gammaproteobacteria bacterium]
MNELGLVYPWALALVPVAVLPFVFNTSAPLAYSSFTLLPRDRFSSLLGLVLRSVAALLIAALIVGIAGLHRPPQLVERLGQGAQMVLLRDRSSSMDQPFAGSKPNQVIQLTLAGNVESKGQVARRLLSEFAARRRNDLFGMLVFSTNPIQTLPLTDKQAIVQAAIDAGNLGKGLAKTDLGQGLLSALAFFNDLPYTGSRIVILISDGAAKLDPGVQERIQNLTHRNRVALYWIYIRSRNSPGIEAPPGAAQDLAPEQLLHRFFQSLATPYRAYSAEDPQALQRAIADISRLQNLPIHYQELIPKRDLTSYCYGVALALLGVLLAFGMLEVKAWRAAAD